MNEPVSATGAEVSAFSLECPPPGFVADPYPWYAALQERQPCHRLSDGSRLLTRHADCLAVYHSRAFSSDKRDFFQPKFGDSPLYEHHTTSPARAPQVFAGLCHAGEIIRIRRVVGSRWS